MFWLHASWHSQRCCRPSKGSPRLQSCRVYPPASNPIPSYKMGWASRINKCAVLQTEIHGKHPSAREDESYLDVEAVESSTCQCTITIAWQVALHETRHSSDLLYLYTHHSAKWTCQPTWQHPKKKCMSSSVGRVCSASSKRKAKPSDEPRQHKLGADVCCKHTTLPAKPGTCLTRH
jgi:hypothetical protein